MATFPIKLSYPLQQEIIYNNVIVSFGDGYEQRANLNSAFVDYDKVGISSGRADGLGTSQTAYRGINRFVINMKNLSHTNQTLRAELLSYTTQRVNILWRFYQDRYGSYESFLFYNPTENTGDPYVDSALVAGTDTKGRYLVRFEQDRLSRDLFIRHLYNSGISLIEVRS